METTAKPTRCEHLTYLSGTVRPGSEKIVFKVHLNLNQQEKARMIRRLNEQFGNSEPCQCVWCNPDTAATASNYV